MNAQLKSPPFSQWDYLNLLVLLVLVLLFFWPVVVEPDSLIYPSYSPLSDLTVIHWPNAHQLSTAYQSYQQIPLWKNVSLSGMSSIANPLAMMYYPPNFLFLRFPVNLIFNVLFVVHVFLSGLGLYLYLRLAVGRSEGACLVAASLYMFSGKLLAHVAAGHVSLIGAMAWLPWIFLGINRAIVHRSWIASILTAMLLALQVLTHTQVLVYTVYFMVPYAAFEVWLAVRREGTTDWRSLGRSALILLPIPVLTAAVGSVQILPLLELTPYSNRALSLQQASEFSLGVPQLLLGVFLPNASAGHEFTIYPGLVMLGLAIIALFGHNRDRRFIIFLVLAVLGLIISLGSAGLLFSAMYWVAPGWRWMRASARAWLFINLALAVLASYGLDSLLDRAHLRDGSGWRALAGFAVALIGLLLGGGLILGYGHVSRATVALTLLPAIGLGLVWLYRLGWINSLVLIVLVLALGIVDSGSFGRSLLIFKPSDEVFAERAVVAREVAEKSRDGPSRVYSPSYSIPQHVASLYGLEHADGVEPVHLERYDRFMSVAGGYGDDSFSVTIPPFPAGKSVNEAHRDTIPDARWLGLLNIRYVVADFPVDADGLVSEGMIEDVYLYRNELALPRAFAVPTARVVPNGEAAWELLPELDFSREAVVEDGDGVELTDRVVEEGSLPVEADVVLLTPNKIVTEVELTAPALLVLSEMWYPGWVAYDNGQPVPILRTDFVLRGVWLDAGHHSVVWVYRPRSLFWGLRVTSISAFLAALALVVLARRRAARASAGKAA